MALKASVKVDTKKVEETIGKIPDDLDASQPGPYHNGFVQAANRYLGFIRERYIKASRGDGTWPDLAMSTKLARARAHSPAVRTRGRDKTTGKFKRVMKKVRMSATARLAGRVFSILYDTGNLFNSLTSGNPDSVETFSKDGVTVGTKNRVAEYHQTGGPRLPKRAILVDPPQEVQTQMMSYIQRGAERAIQARTEKK